MNRRLFFVAAIAAVLVQAGCDLDGEPRQLPTPDFDGGALFPSLEQRTGDGDRRRGGGVDERARALMDGEDVEEPSTRSMQTVSLGGSLVSEIPADFETWTWSQQGGVTVVDYTPVGEAPSALIVTRQVRVTTPARQMRQFLGDVDSSMGDGFDFAELRRAAGAGELTRGGAGDTVDLEALLDSLAGGNSLTGGRGLGYRSHADSFSGWRWMGQNRGEVFVRAAATEGLWGPQPPTPPGLSQGNLQAIIDQAAGESGGASPLDSLDIDSALEQLSGLSTSSGQPSPQQPAPTVELERPRLPTGTLAAAGTRRARMLVGELDSGDGDIVQFAVICVAEPNCPVAAELAELFDQIRLAETRPSGRQGNFDEHIERLGLKLSP